MCLSAAFLVAAAIAMSGTVHAASIVNVASDGSSPSSVSVGLPESASGSLVAIGMPGIDAGKVAAVDTEDASRELAPELMVIRGGEVGSASPEPLAVAVPTTSAAPAQQAAAGDQPPLPASSDGSAADPAAAPVETR